MASHLESSSSSPQEAVHPRPRGWLGLGILAAASAVAGGVAAAWYYRQTLARLRQAEAHASDFASLPHENDTEEDV